MEATQKETLQRQSRRKQIALFSLLIVLAAQVNLDVFTNNFLVSIGILLFPVFVYLFQEIPLIPITLFSGIGVFLSRFLIYGLQSGFHTEHLMDFFPEFFFYLSYGTASSDLEP